MHQIAGKNRNAGKTNKKIATEKERIIIVGIAGSAIDQIENPKYGHLIIH